MQQAADHLFDDFLLQLNEFGQSSNHLGLGQTDEDGNQASNIVHPSGVHAANAIHKRGGRHHGNDAGEVRCARCLAPR